MKMIICSLCIFAALGAATGCQDNRGESVNEQRQERNAMEPSQPSSPNAGPPR